MGDPGALLRAGRGGGQLQRGRDTGRQGGKVDALPGPNCTSVPGELVPATRMASPPVRPSVVHKLLIQTLTVHSFVMQGQRCLRDDLRIHNSVSDPADCPNPHPFRGSSKYEELKGSAATGSHELDPQAQHMHCMHR